MIGAALELDLRRVSGVSAVTSAQRDGVDVVHLLVTDPAREEEIRQEATELVTASTDRPHRVVVRVSGLPQERLLLESQLSEAPGVRACSVIRGARGEVLRISVRLGDREGLDLVSRIVASSTDGAIPPGLVAAEYSTDVDPGEISGSPPAEPGSEVASTVLSEEWRLP